MRLLRNYFMTSLLLTVTFSGTGCGDDAATVIVCDQPYALCSAAPCIPDPKNPDTGICTCDVFDGPSAGIESCEKRKPFTGADNAQRVVSTFSFRHVKSSKLICPSGTLWANCIDAPCTVNPTEPSRAICSCPFSSTGQVATFGGNRDVSTCATAHWSATLASTHKKSGEALAAWGQSTVPAGFVNPSAIAAGGDHTCAIDDNEVTCGGWDGFEQSAVPASLEVSHPPVPSYPFALPLLILLAGTRVLKHRRR